ncbi:MAG TPA: TonB-dependent receptor plug domain-containing protein, partial [Parapedobacter sp.]|nr:TonB-dependent receptor plug domain-containing protein [Parapedobacter sp.]
MRDKRKLNLVVYFFLLPVLFMITMVNPYVALGQERTIRGQVIDSDNAPMSGVTIRIKDTDNATSTDESGRYNIAASEGAVLVFSLLGHETQEIVVGDATTIDVRLRSSSRDMEEVLVTALGVKRESRKLGYSATAVNTDEMTTNRTTNMMESLVGKVSGLNITPPAGGAGSSMQIRLRGQAAFAGANNSPLIIVNGLPMDQGARGANGAGQMGQRDRGDNLQNINPDDIESMTVLKGATAAAIYGARAANGAIIITTKSGQSGQGIGVEFTSTYTAQQPLNFMDEIIQTEYGQGTGGTRPRTQGEAQSTGQFGFGERLDGAPTINFDGIERPYSANPDRLFDFLRTGAVYTNTIALSGGGEKGSFRTSFSNTNAAGIQPSNDY